ncbi:hypothetical protein EDB80DRAFT_900626 [Ilyonectria destructans]|nr:hypothetical protein EDB80DRAFT_900626 [Ilyonectria destructans]
MQRRNGNPAEAPPFSIRLLEHENEHAGELRLSRLNKIYEFSQTPLRGYMPRWNHLHRHCLDRNAGLATESLARNDAFQSASHGFTVFSILGPLVAASFIMLAFCSIFIRNWIKAINCVKRRLG